MIAVPCHCEICFIRLLSFWHTFDDRVLWLNVFSCTKFYTPLCIWWPKTCVFYLCSSFRIQSKSFGDYLYIYFHRFIYWYFISEGVILTCLLLFGSAGILKVWTGLSVSPFRSWIRIQDQIRIRLRDGYMEQEYGIIFSWERLPRIYVQVTPSSWKHYSDIK